MPTPQAQLDWIKLFMRSSAYVQGPSFETARIDYYLHRTSFLIWCVLAVVRTPTTPEAHSSPLLGVTDLSISLAPVNWPITLNYLSNY